MYNKYIMKCNNILFIRGFNTDNIETNDTYSHIRIVLSQKNSIIYFNYNPNDDIMKTYQKLCKVIHRKKFTHLIAHSLGCGFLMKYISDHPNKIQTYKKIILLMPFIYKIPIIHALSNIPFIKHVYLPKLIFLPNSKLISLGNFLNDEYKLISLTQIFDMYTKLLLNSDIFVDLLNKHRKNTVIFYAKDEYFNVIPQGILDEIYNKEYINGLHESFNSLPNCKQFFDKLLRYI